MDVPEVIKVDLSHFPMDERFAQIPGKLVLADNLDGDDFLYEGHPHPSFPVQVTMFVSIICISGRMEITLDLNQYTLTDGYTVSILPGSFFQMEHIQEGTRCIFIAISPGFVNVVGNVRLGIEFGRQLKEEPVHQSSPDTLRENLVLYRELKQKLLDRDYLFKEEVAKNFMRIIQCNVYQKFVEEAGKRPEPKATSRKEELFVQFMALVKEHYMEKRNIVFYASQLCVSPKYLSSVVHEVSGEYASAWINKHVILEAKTMLREKDMSIKQVSFKLHFANQSFFAKYFKQHTGYTPKEYKAL